MNTDNDPMQPAVGLTTPAEATPADPSLAKIVEDEIQSGRVELPVLPEVAIQVHNIVVQEGPAAEIVSVLEHEPSLAAAVLRYANSVAFAGLREVTELNQAVTRLGLKAVEQTILALSARNAFRATDQENEETYRTLWNHSVVTAVAARRLAPRALGIGPEMAFLAGLLHDIGKLVLLRCATSLRSRGDSIPSVTQRNLNEFFDALHCHVGDRLCESWNIPGEIRQVVLRHHDVALDGSKDILIAIVQLADRVATKLGASLRPDPHVSLLDAPAAAMLRLDDTRIANLLIDIEDDLEEMKQVFPS